jgi:hypothetical protein
LAWGRPAYVERGVFTARQAIAARAYSSRTPGHRGFPSFPHC